MVYEDFAFAPRLFSAVGLAKMVDWAQDLLLPILDQPILLDGLRRYFELNLNIIAAAEALNVHHNSLRYRLAKIEDALGVSLRDPSTISSLYLALTALAVSDDDDAHLKAIPARTARPGRTPAGASDA